MALATVQCIYRTAVVARVPDMHSCMSGPSQQLLVV